jgi:hypothetical protein
LYSPGHHSIKCSLRKLALSVIGYLPELASFPCSI